MVLYEPFEGRVFQIPESLAMGRVQNQKDIQAETGIGKEPTAFVTRTAQNSVHQYLTGQRMGRNIAVILAGGSGARLGSDVPKQFLEIDGRTILEYSIEAFENHPAIDAIAIVSRSDYMERVRSIVSGRGYHKVERIIPGGKERYHSSLAAINVYEDDDILLFHDAVRPLVSSRIIDDCLAAMKKYNAVDVAFNTTDTIIQVDSDNCICAIPDRTFLRNGQTPQCFRRSVISKAYNVALADPKFKTTDDCGVVLRYLPEEPVYVVQGDVTNMKVTYKEDLEQIQRLLHLREVL